MRPLYLALFQASLFLFLLACGTKESSQLKDSRASLDKCSDLVGTCEYYRCVENERISCGETGYPLGYGERYCQILSGLDYPQAIGNYQNQLHPSNGNVWKVEVRECLQVEMERYFREELNPNCKDLRAFAFNSHPLCYTGTTSFCDMNPFAIATVGLNIAPKDLASAESLKQVKDTADICIRHFDKRLANESGFFLKLDLIKFRTLWQTIRLTPTQLPQWIARFAETGEAKLGD